VHGILNWRSPPIQANSTKAQDGPDLHRSTIFRKRLEISIYSVAVKKHQDSTTDRWDYTVDKRVTTLRHSVSGRCRERPVVAPPNVLEVMEQVMEPRGLWSRPLPRLVDGMWGACEARTCLKSDVCVMQLLNSDGTVHYNYTYRCIYRSNASRLQSTLVSHPLHYPERIPLRPSQNFFSLLLRTQITTATWPELSV
jgi:hypothetical protein